MYSYAKVLIYCATLPLTPIMKMGEAIADLAHYATLTYALAFLNDFVPAVNAARLKGRSHWRVQRQRRFLLMSFAPLTGRLAHQIKTLITWDKGLQTAMPCPLEVDQDQTSESFCVQ